MDAQDDEDDFGAAIAIGSESTEAEKEFERVRFIVATARIVSM